MSERIQGSRSRSVRTTPKESPKGPSSVSAERPAAARADGLSGLRTDVFEKPAASGEDGRPLEKEPIHPGSSGLPGRPPDARASIGGQDAARPDALLGEAGIGGRIADRKEQAAQAQTPGSVAGDAMGIAGPSREGTERITRIGGEAVTPESLVRELNSVIAAPDRSGGLDGRNRASDGGGAATRPQGGAFEPDESGAPDLTTDTTMGGNAFAGSGLRDRSAAGKLTPGQLAVLQKYDAEARAANAAEDHEGVARANRKAHDFLVQEGINPKQERRLGRRAHRLRRRGGRPEAGRGDVLDRREVQVPRAGAGALQVDRLPHGGRAPGREGDGGDRELRPPGPGQRGGPGTRRRSPRDLHRDFTDAYFESKRKAAKDSTGTPDPDDVGGPLDTAVPTDITAPAEQYGENGAPVDQYDVDDRPPPGLRAPEEEF